MLDARDQDEVVAAMRESARDALDYARTVLRRYRRHVNRSNVRGTDRDDTIDSRGDSHAQSACWTISIACQKLRGSEFRRLERVVERHAERIGRQFKALRDRDYEQIQAAYRAKKNAEWKAWCEEFNRPYKPVYPE